MKLSVAASLLLSILPAAVQSAVRIDRRTLMKGAIPVDSQGRPRRLEEQEGEEGEEEGFQLSGDYSLQFDRCLSIHTQPADASFLYDENILPYSMDGRVLSQKSYVLVNVCKTKYCDYYVGDENLFMIDLETYMAATTVYYQERTENYCTACLYSRNYCTWIDYQRKHGKSDNWNAWLATSQNMYDDAIYAYQQEQYAEEAEEEGEEEGEGDRRHLLDYKNYQVVDCETCDAMGCWDKVDAQEEVEPDDDYAAKVWAYKQQIQAENVGDWVEEFTECKETNMDFMNDGQYNYPMYAGFMCNQDGSGVEIAMFLDDACTIYAGTASYFKSIRYSEEDKQYLQMAKDMIMFPFQHELDCNGEARFVTLQTYRNYAQNYQYQNNQEDEEAELSEYCQAIFGDGDNGDNGENAEGAISLRDCESDGDYENGGEDMDDWVNDNDGYNMEYYLLSYEDSFDITESCKVVKDMHGRYPSVYRWSGSGQLFNYGTTYRGNYLENLRQWHSQFDRVDGTLIASIVVGVLVALLSFGCILYSICHPHSLPNKFTVQRSTDPSKRERLVDPVTGDLA